MMKSFIRALSVATCFLTRFSWCGTCTKEDMLSMVRVYPVVGLFVGAVCVVPFWWLSLSQGFVLQAWLFLALQAWLTRCLHWDAVMDMADAVGSNAQGDKFWAILKDSQVGAFAVIAILFIVGVLVASISILFEYAAFLPLLLAPVLGRSACVLFASMNPVWVGSSLAILVKQGMSRQNFWFAMLASCTVLYLGLGLSWGVLCLLVIAVFYRVLSGKARQVNGFNGDFLGVVLVGSEVIFIACVALKLVSTSV